jgi:H+/Cl- antiporter ClcA
MSFLGEHIDGFGKSGGRFGMAFLVFSVSNLVLTLFASIITAFIAPAAAGSGIPEVKAYLNGVDAPGIFSLRTLVVKVAIFLWSFLDSMACFAFRFQQDWFQRAC